MKDREIPALIIASLIIGSIFGAGISYIVYQPQIASLNSDIVQIRGEIKAVKERGSGSDTAAAIKAITTEIEDIKALISSESKAKKDEERIIEVYNNVSPAVVFITSTALSFDFQRKTTVPEVGVGSGVVVSPEGYILTNNHVVEGAENITVSFKPGEELVAELVGTDPATDLAVLKIDPSPELPVAALGDSDKVVPGMTAIAIGNPFSLERTVTLGVISSVNRTLDAETGDIIFGVIQTDASVNPGNSGGPLLNLDGEVVGINSAIISPVSGSVGIGFAIPINTAKRVMTELIEKGYVSRPYLGITGVSVGEFPSELNLSENGVLIVDVITDSPADKAGLRGSDTEFQVGSIIYPVGGDIITSLDGHEINTIENLLEALSKKDVGDRITLGYIRDGVEEAAVVVLEERPG